MLLEEEFMAYRFCGSQNGTFPCGTVSIVGAFNWLRQCYKVSKLVCMILIPEAASGPRLRYGCTPLDNHASVHHVDTAGRRYIEVEYLMRFTSFIACKQDLGSCHLTSLRMVPFSPFRAPRVAAYTQDPSLLI
jgi:hypothetical protein